MSSVQNLDFRITDKQNSLNLQELGAWAQYAIKLGYLSFAFDDPRERLFSLVAVPSREIFGPLVVLGAMISSIEVQDLSDFLTWSEFKELEEGLTIFFDDNGKFRQGVLGAFDQDLGGRRIENTGRGNASHFFFEGNFAEKRVAFKRSAATSGGNANPSAIAIAKVLPHIDGKKISAWAKSNKPTIVIHANKRAFLASSNTLCFDLGHNPKEEEIDFSKFMHLTEEERFGSGKILLKSVRRSAVSTETKLAIINTPRFESLAPAYASSNIIMIVENQEYDERIAELARLLRKQSSTEVPESCKTLLTPAPPVRSFVSKVPRY